MSNFDSEFIPRLGTTAKAKIGKSEAAATTGVMNCSRQDERTLYRIASHHDHVDDDIDVLHNTRMYTTRLRIVHVLIHACFSGRNVELHFNKEY